MNKLGSQFLEDFIKEEKEVLFQLTARNLVLLIGMISSVTLLTVLFFLEWPVIFIYLVGGLLVIPTMVFGLSIDKRLSLVERLYFVVLIKRRVYQTERLEVKEYSKSDFIPKKHIKETDSF